MGGKGSKKKSQLIAKPSKKVYNERHQQSKSDEDSEIGDYEIENERESTDDEDEFDDEGEFDDEIVQDEFADANEHVDGCEHDEVDVENEDVGVGNEEQVKEKVCGSNEGKKWRMSLINTENRKKRKNMHRAGPKSLALYREEIMRSKGNNEEPTAVEMFIATRTPKEGKLLDEDTRLKMDQFQEFMTQAPSDSTVANEKFAEIMGVEHPGRLRGFGRTITSRTISSQIVGATRGVKKRSEI
ncbi:hypothetical protein COCNU_scaffold003533G000020 [Cocos nucifera]|nr:hypothetical protein [Cocos nucifera]